MQTVHQWFESIAWPRATNVTTVVVTALYMLWLGLSLASVSGTGVFILGLVLVAALLVHVSVLTWANAKNPMFWKLIGLFALTPGLLISLYWILFVL
jgi:uncharacterized membrane protein YecN with MAPEG domain